MNCVFFESVYNTKMYGAWRSPASALAWGARGPGFKSQCPDSFFSREKEKEDAKASSFSLLSTGYCYFASSSIPIVQITQCFMYSSSEYHSFALCMQ